MVSIRASFGSATPRLRAPLYHTITSRILQKRFVHACVCLLVLLYSLAYLLGRHHGPWFLFPWSWTGFRTLALFAALAPLLLLRKANLHVTRRARPLSLGNVLSGYTAMALAGYLLSATIFVALYLNNASDKSKLGLLITQRSYELPRLNERWLYMAFLGVLLGTAATIRHIVMDLDLLERPLVKRPIPVRMREELPSVLLQSTLHATLFCLLAPFCYLVVRTSLYSFALRSVRLIYRVPRSTVPPAWPVGLDMFARTLFLATLPILSWNVLHWLFNVYLSQGPTFKGKLLSQKSMQQDETLLNGLQHAGKPLTQLLAFEELRIIASQEKERRVAIFETGAPDATLWLAIVDACSAVLGEATESVNLASGASSLSPPAASHQQSQQQPAKPRVIGTPPPVQVHQANIFLSGHKNPSIVDKLKSQTQPVASALQHPERAGNTPGKSVVTTVKQHVLEFTQPLWQPVSELGIVRLLAQILRARDSVMPRHEYAVLAIESLRDMLLASLADDTFGRAHKDVPRVLAALEKLQNAIARLKQVRQTKQQDVEERERSPLLSDEVSTVEAIASDARQVLLDAFRAYL